MTTENPTAHEAIVDGDLPRKLYVCPSCHLAWWAKKSTTMAPTVRLTDGGPICRDCERTMVPFEYHHRDIRFCDHEDCDKTAADGLDADGMCEDHRAPQRAPILKRICEGPKAHKYEVKPLVDDGRGGGWYSSDQDFCPKCGAPARAR